MNRKNCLLLSLLSIVLCLGLIPLGMYGHHWKILAASLLYFTITLFFLRKTESTKGEWLVAAIMAIPPLALFLPLHIRDFTETRISLPSTIAHFGGIGFALVTHHQKEKMGLAFAVLFLALAPLAAFTGYPLWLNRLNYGTFTSKVNYPLPAPISGMLQNQQSLQMVDLKGKVIVLDFWHTRCGVCFSKFPQVQEVYNQYKGNPSFALLAVNKPLKTDSTGQAFAMLQKRNYSFPVLIPSDASLPKAFGVRVYPTTVVIDKTGSVIFKGSIEKAKDVIDELLTSDL